MLIPYFQTVSKDICQRPQKILEARGTLSVCAWSKLQRLHFGSVCLQDFSVEHSD